MLSKFIRIYSLSTEHYETYLMELSKTECYALLK